MGRTRDPTAARQVDAGDYHVEMVAKDTSLVVYLNDDNDKPVDAKGHKATGIFVVDGKPQRIELKPESANKLTGTSTVPLPATSEGRRPDHPAVRQDGAGESSVATATMTSGDGHVHENHSCRPFGGSGRSWRFNKFRAAIKPCTRA